MSHTREPSGALVVRAWVEVAAPKRLRVRITHIDDLDVGRAETTAASIDEVLVTVQAWLERLLAEASCPPSGPS